MGTKSDDDVLHGIELRAYVGQEASKLMDELHSDGFDDPNFVVHLRDLLSAEKRRRKNLTRGLGLEHPPGLPLTEPADCFMVIRRELQHLRLEFGTKALGSGPTVCPVPLELDAGAEELLLEFLQARAALRASN